MFERLRERLRKDAVRLSLVHGVGTPAELKKQDGGYIEWAQILPTYYLLHHKLCWQPFANRTQNSDLTIITQENALLANHLALFLKPSRRLAFWGHGANFQKKIPSISEQYKRFTTLQVDWYFAYTEISRKLIEKTGFPPDRITQLDNAIDTGTLRRQIEKFSEHELAKFKNEKGINSASIGLYLGSLYSQKRIDFLIESARRIKEKQTDFQMLLVGDGPDREIVASFADGHDWVHYLGPLEGEQKAMVLRLATIILNPGLVGLGILDSFLAEAPLVTTDCKVHSPEIAYLNDTNGVMTEDNVDAYVEACCNLLRNETARQLLIAGCRSSARRYTLDNMVENFAKGILRALQ